MHQKSNQFHRNVIKNTQLVVPPPSPNETGAFKQWRNAFMILHET